MNRLYVRSIVATPSRTLRLPSPRTFDASGLRTTSIISPMDSPQIRMKSSSIVSVFTEEGVRPIGPHSQAIRANGLVFVSGQIPANIDGSLIEGSVAEKTYKMCQNAAAVLKAAGSGLDKAVKITVYFQDLSHFKEINDVYAEYFPQKPARSSMKAIRLRARVSMEMDIIALE